ncbi:cytochrome P450 [Gemmatirosa kalamazoonensis]|uniref:Cytochrome P450 n=1 Tax=Gemmatirosa kalamazoonensis TaxID=861299 RepID=W0RFY1_9BACT|nr:cytochrome P450 [Gemmatirosa kalamazoonensis]AHG89225.1 cytochrome P450 [Gemmatirosa kalamazoonensis]
MTAPSAGAASLGAAPLGPTLEPALVAWFGATSFPDGGDDAAPLGQAAFEATYARLLAAARAPGLLPPLFALEAPLAAIRPDAPVPVAVADVPVSIADADEARAAAARAFDGAPATAADVATALAPNAHSSRAFLAAALLHEQWGRDAAVYRGRDVTYVLDERFWVALPGMPRPDAIELDPGDGAGARAVSLGGTVAATYAEGVTTATVTLRARYGAESRTARFTLPVGGPPAAPVPDETWPLSAEVPNEAPVTGTASVWHGAGNARVTYPIVVGEGFPGGYAPDYMYDMLNQAGLADALRARGWDLVVVHYASGTDPIQRSARVVTACVGELHRRGAPPQLVGGVSMGGLVSRYALLRMDADGVAHGAHTFLTVDSPHRGAYTAAGDQWLALRLAPVSPLAATLAGALATSANQQFVMRVVDGDRVGPSALRAALLAELQALGDWPRGVRRLAVSSGSGAGVVDRATASGPALTLDGAPFAELRLYLEPAAGEHAVVAAGRCAVAAPGVPDTLTVTSDERWADVPGGTNDYTAIAAGIARALGSGDVTCDAPICCSVPTVSALALDQDPRAPVPPPSSGASPFHDYACAERDEHHCVITPSVAAWILDRLGSPHDVRPTPEREAAMATTVRPAVTYAPPAAPSPTTFDPSTVNVHDPAYLANPYPTYARLRAGAPVAALAPYPGVWVTRYDDVKAALLDQDTFRKAPVSAAPGAMPAGVFSADPPFHDAIRGVVEPPMRRAFARAAAAANGIVDEILAGIRASGTRRLDLMMDYALLVPSGTLFTLLGLPQSDWPMLRSMVTAIAGANDITQSVGVRTMGGMSAMALSGYCQGVLRVAAGAPPELWVLRQMLDAATAAGLDAADVQTSVVNFIVAGYLSTTFLIGTAVVNLLANPEQLAALRADPSRIDNAVQELMRYDAPAQLVDRVTSRDVTIAGTTVPAGTVVKLVLGSANRDETKFPDPDRLDIGRPDLRETAIPFGAGIHTCIGAPLVGIVAPIAIGRLVGELPNVRVDGLVTWQTDPYLRAPANVPLAI